MGRPLVLGVQLDRLDHQKQSIRAVDFARRAISSIRSEAQVFCEVQEAIYTLSVAIQHEEHGAGAVFHPREQEQMIGAEIKHPGGIGTRAGAAAPAHGQRR